MKSSGSKSGSSRAQGVGIDGGGQSSSDWPIGSRSTEAAAADLDDGAEEGDHVRCSPALHRSSVNEIRSWSSDHRVLCLTLLHHFRPRTMSKGR